MNKIISNIGNIRGNGNMVINGKVYEKVCGSLTITDKGIFINGKPVEEYKEPPVIKIEITGTVENIESENADVTVNGSAGSVTSKNGNVQVSNGVKGNVDTKNGNITVDGGVGGDVTTKNGNITRL